MNLGFREQLREIGVDQVVAMVSRRAAGVWSLLPSLAIQNLADIRGFANVLLVDFGMRDEMLKHLQMDAAHLSSEQSLLGICFELAKNDSFSPKLLEYNARLLTPSSLLESNVPSSEKPTTEYLAYISSLEHLGKKLFLCPYAVGNVNEDKNQPKITVQMLESALLSIVMSTKANLIYLTFEGQPESPIFDKKLSSDSIMQYCLSLSDVILSLVRTDAMPRFEEGVAIPQSISQNLSWQPKIRLFLTRHPETIEIPSVLDPIVIGQSPFSDEIGQSVQSGRIPLVDIMTKRYGLLQSTVTRYLLGLKKASEHFVANTNRRKEVNNHFVLAYVNPDTDGVCSSIAYADLLKKTKGYSATPIVIGRIDNETRFVLTTLDVDVPKTDFTFSSENSYHIVDTHQVNQLPAELPLHAVVEVIDHHPVGEPAAFPNAVVLNETLGAVATVIAERFQSLGEIDSQIGTLLYAAIISNTLDFKAPSTTQRDRDAAVWLLSRITLPTEFTDRMFAARSDLDGRHTRDILLGDYKEFEFSGHRVGISQLETTDLYQLLHRSDLEQAIVLIQQEKALPYYFFNGADIRKEAGALVASDAETRRILEEAMEVTFKGAIAETERILLRKTDILPQLKTYFERDAHP